MGCGIAHIGRRGLETTQTEKIGIKSCPQGFGLAAQLGVWTHGGKGFDSRQSEQLEKWLVMYCMYVCDRQG